MVRFLPLALFATFTLYADLVEQGPKDAKPSGLWAGAARADITPPVGIPQMNWGSQTHVESVAIDPAGMFATALVVSDGRQKFAMVDIDVLSIHRMDDVVSRASQITGIPANHIRLGATHTHAGPLLSGEKGPVGFDLNKYQKSFWNYWDLMGDKIVGAIIEANAKLVPVHVAGAKGIGSISVNRRMRRTPDSPPAVGPNPEGFLDRDLTVVRIDDAEGKPFAVIVNFQCHGTTLAWENKVISPDWVGMVRKVVEQALPGSKCLFFQGAAGNQGPVEGMTGDLSVAHRLGRILGHEAAAIALRIETVRRAPKFEGFVESTAYIAPWRWRVDGPRDGTLRFAQKVLELPARTYTSQEIARMSDAVRDAEQKMEVARKSNDPWKQHVAEARWRRFRDLLAKWRKPPEATSVKVRVQALRIGEVAIVAMPGEPFAEIGAAIKKASPFPVTLFCGYSSGEGGDYMPVESEYALEGYEVDRSPYGVGAAAKLVRETSALVAQIRGN